MHRKELESWDDGENGFDGEIHTTEEMNDFEDEEYSDGENEQEFTQQIATDGDWEFSGSHNGDNHDEDDGEGGFEIEIQHSLPDDSNFEVNIEIVNSQYRAYQIEGVDINHHNDDGDEGLEEEDSLNGEEEMDYDSYTDGEENFDDFTDDETLPADQNEPLQVIVNNNTQYAFSDYSLPQGEIEHEPAITPQNRHCFEDCSICFTPIYKKGQNSCYLECVHWYHFECLKIWCSQSRNCPVCRTQFVNILKVK